MKSLVIVDFQYDFCAVDGTLSVKGADVAGAGIIDFVKSNAQDISTIIFTQDWHPVNHCSFSKNGGIWPVHCVENTHGAGIMSDVFVALSELVGSEKIQIFKKGKNPQKEEYSAAMGLEKTSTGDVILKETFGEMSEVKFAQSSELVVAGIAGDYCVLETVKSLVEAGLEPKVLLAGVASVGDGYANEALKAWLVENKIETI